uniref:G-protein coupled receptors family 1 profile domain-containing protein n=1 Tax=Panagrolaimus sp. PS1159 TaxID=55785 RepID=A0AC35GY65_9BILA
MTSTTFDDDTIIDFVKTASRVAFASAAAIGIPGNLFVLFAIIYSRDLRTVSNIFIFNLALADLLFLMGVPILIIQSIKGEWIFGPIVCKLYLASSGVNQFASATFMGVLSFDRYLAVCHAVSSTRIRTKKFAAVLVLISWIIVIIEVAPLIKFSKVVERPNRYNKTTASCTIYWGDMDKFDDQVVKIRRIFTTYSFTFSYLIPLIGQNYYPCMAKTLSILGKSTSTEKTNDEDTFIQKVFRRNADPFGTSFNPSRKHRNFKSPIYSPVSLANGKIVIPSARDDVTL